MQAFRQAAAIYLQDRPQSMRQDSSRSVFCSALLLAAMLVCKEVSGSLHASAYLDFKVAASSGHEEGRGSLHPGFAGLQHQLVLYTQPRPYCFRILPKAHTPIQSCVACDTSRKKQE